MAKRYVGDGIAGGRTVTIEIKIPKGLKCRSCKAKLTINEHFGEYICLLYGKKLSWTSYQTSERHYAGGPKVTKYACEKCEACLNGSREFAAGIAKEVSMNG